MARLPDGRLKVTMNNPRMIIGLSVLLCLYLAFGLMGCAEAATPRSGPTIKSTGSF